MFRHTRLDPKLQSWVYSYDADEEVGDLHSCFPF